jgi:hypothetical protein
VKAPGDSDDPDLDNIAKEVNEDIAKGEGEKHFQDVFDEVSSTQGRASAIDPDLREKLERFANVFRLGLGQHLRGNAHGFHCKGVSLDGHGQGFICKFKDKDGRPFEVLISYEDSFQEAARRGVVDMGRGMIDIVISRLFAARVKYLERLES